MGHDGGLHFHAGLSVPGGAKCHGGCGEGRVGLVGRDVGEMGEQWVGGGLFGTGLIDVALVIVKAYAEPGLGFANVGESGF
jgi:hypothetical protein